MRQFGFAGSVAAIAAVTVVAAPAAQAQEISYRLPEATIVAGVAETLLSCGSDPQVKREVTIAGLTQPGEIVRLDPNNPFLGSRNLEIAYFEDGTIQKINASGEGSGGAVIASVLKSAVGFLTMGPLGGLAGLGGFDSTKALGSGANASPQFALTPTCEPEIRQLVEKRAGVVKDIEQFEQDVASEATIDPLRRTLYVEWLKQRTALDRALTLRQSVKLEGAGSAWRGKIAPDGSIALYDQIPTIDRKKWFGATADRFKPKTSDLPYCVAFTASEPTLRRSKAVPTLDLRQWRRAHLTDEGNLNENILSDRFVYRRPVPVSVDIRQKSATTQNCETDFASLVKTETETVPVPQLSEYFIMKLDNGAFGSRSLKAEFRADGSLVSFGSSSGSAGSGGAASLEGLYGAATTLRDSETARLKRELDRADTEKKLKDLRDAAKPT